MSTHDYESSISQHPKLDSVPSLPVGHFPPCLFLNKHEPGSGLGAEGEVGCLECIRVDVEAFCITSLLLLLLLLLLLRDWASSRPTLSAPLATNGPMCWAPSSDLLIILSSSTWISLSHLLINQFWPHYFEGRQCRHAPDPYRLS